MAGGSVQLTVSGCVGGGGAGEGLPKGALLLRSRLPRLGLRSSSMRLHTGGQGRQPEKSGEGAGKEGRERSTRAALCVRHT